MKRQIFSSILFFVLASTAFAADVEMKVKVLIKDQLRGALFKANNLKIATTTQEPPIELTSDTVYVTALYRNFKIKDGDQVHIRVAEGLQISGDGLTLDGNLVPGSVSILPRNTNRLRVVAELDIEKYLLGVVPSEMPSHWPIEALKAQAVASRSYAMAIASSRKKEDYHLEATVFHQVYSYSNWKKLGKAQQNKIFQAVMTTKGQYLVAENSKSPMKSYYHADCGGRTESAEAVWSYAKGPRGVHDKACSLRGKSEWTFQVSKSEFLKDFKDISSVDEVVIVGRSGSGRASKVLVRDLKNKNDHYFQLNDFRKILGFSNLKSGLFSVAVANDTIQFNGRGYGHGVGLCQMGSRLLAASGEVYKSILKRYFPTAEVTLKDQSPMLTAQQDKGEVKSL